VQRPTRKGAQDERQRAGRIRGPATGQRNATGQRISMVECTKALVCLQGLSMVYALDFSEFMPHLVAP
jgi:hypothetical protein